MKSSTITIVPLLFSFISAASAEEGTVKIATDAVYPPWSSTSASGKLEGFEIDLAEFICETAQLKCEIIPQNWDGIIPALQAGKFDVIMGGMSITDERMKVISFTAPYALGGNIFMVMKDGDLFGSGQKGAHDFVDPQSDKGKELVAGMASTMGGKTIGVQGTTTASSFLETWMPDAIVREYKSTEEHNLDLTSGRLDAIFANYTVQAAALERAELANGALIGPVFTTGFIGAGLRKDDMALKEAFDKAIAAGLQNGAIKDLSMKWFKVDVTPRQ